MASRRLYGIVYDQYGRVDDWGPANDTMMEDIVVTRNDAEVLYGVHMVDCWRVIKVTAFIRDFATSQPYYGDHGWEAHQTFWIKDWAAMETVYRALHAEEGWYTRVSFFAEVYKWNEAGKWSFDDCI